MHVFFLMQNVFILFNYNNLAICHWHGSKDIIYKHSTIICPSNIASFISSTFLATKYCCIIAFPAQKLQPWPYFLLVNGSRTELDHDLSMTLTYIVKVLNFAIIRYNTVINEWIVVILKHSMNLDKILKKTNLKLTHKCPWPSKSMNEFWLNFL